MLKYRSRPGFQVVSQNSNAMKANLTIPAEEDGMISRLCPNDQCRPRYFKVKLGTGIVGVPEPVMYCPYCQQKGDPGDFHTPAQIRYGEDVLKREVERAMVEALQDMTRSFNRSTPRDSFIQFKLEVKADAFHYVPRPEGMWARRVLICGKCGLEHSVYGLSEWCPDCSTPTFALHVGHEVDCIGRQLADLDRREKELGGDVAQRDIDNILEDIVSFYEGFMKFVWQRHLLKTLASETADEKMKKAGNVFQRFEESLGIVEGMGCRTCDLVAEGERNRLDRLFKSRHVVTHNLGVADEKFVAKTGQGHLLHMDVRILRGDLAFAVGVVEGIIRATYQTLSLGQQGLT